MKYFVVKISGEFFKEGNTIFTSEKFSFLTKQILSCKEKGYIPCLVLGGGNIARGRDHKVLSFSQCSVDRSGMLATVINGILLKDSLSSFNCRSVLFSPFSINSITNSFSEGAFHKCIESQEIPIFVGGVGLPYFSTDLVAVERSIEIASQYLVKMSYYPFIYDKDPKVFSDATPFSSISYNDLLKKDITYIDQSALVLARNHSLSIFVTSFRESSIDSLFLDIDSLKGTWIVNQ